MKIYIAALAFILIIAVSCNENETSNLAVLSTTLPNDTALVFADGMVSTDAFEFAITFTPNMDELFFTRRIGDGDNAIYSMSLVDGAWSEPKPAFFKAQKGWDFEPHVDPKGHRLYFGSTRPLPDSTKSTGLHQWYSNKTETGWGTPVPLESPFVDKSVIMYLTSAENGNLYFTTGEKGDTPEDWVIYNANKEQEGYGSIQRMGTEINGSGKWIAHSYIAPDESYMLYDFKSESGFGEADIYISFNKEGSWTEPFNLGPQVNTVQTEMCPSVSPDGKYLFFHRGGDDSGDIYWIDFRPIKEALRDPSSINN